MTTTEPTHYYFTAGLFGHTAHRCSLLGTPDVDGYVKITYQTPAHSLVERVARQDGLVPLDRVHTYGESFVASSHPGQPWTDAVYIVLEEHDGSPQGAVSMTPREARELARRLLEAADRADLD